MLHMSSCHICVLLSHMKKEVSFSIPLARARQLLDTEVGAQVLGASAVGIGQVLCVDTEAVSGVADAVTLL